MSNTEKQIIGPRARASAKEVEELRKRLARLEFALAKIATLAGHGNYLKEFGLERWVPTNADTMKGYG